MHTSITRYRDFHHRTAHHHPDASLPTGPRGPRRSPVLSRQELREAILAMVD